MEVVGSRLDTDACYGTFRIAELSIKRCCLHLKFLNDVARRNIARYDLILVRRCGARNTVDGEVHAIAPDAVNRKADNVGWFKRTIESRVTCVGRTRRQTDEGVRIAVN